MLSNEDLAPNHRKYFPNMYRIFFTAVMKDFDRSVISQLILGTISTVIFVVLVTNNTIDFSTTIKYSAEDLSEEKDRVLFLFKLSAIPVVWLFLWIVGAILFRVYRLAVLPLDYHEHLVQKAILIFRISVEHIIASLICQMALVLFPSDNFPTAEMTLKYIPALNFLFIFGRTPVWLECRHFWIFGFITTVAPAMLSFI